MTPKVAFLLSQHIYGMAPTRIIYLIATNYILGFDESLKKEILEGDAAHFVEADAAKHDRLEALVARCFG